MTDDLWQRAWNWGRYTWRELMAEAPDSSCVNHIYDMGGSPDAAAWGEVDGDTVVVEQVIEARAELPEIDDPDAESLHGWIRQIPKGAQLTLWRRFVYRHRIGRDEVDNALRLVGQAMDSNRATVALMRRMGHG